MSESPVPKKKKTVVEPVIDVEEPQELGEPIQAPYSIAILEEMNFPMAMIAVVEGKRVSRLSWKNGEHFIFATGKNLYLHRADTGHNHPWILSFEDVVGVDWVVV